MGDDASNVTAASETRSGNQQLSHDLSSLLLRLCLVFFYRHHPRSMDIGPPALKNKNKNKTFFGSFGEP